MPALRPPTAAALHRPTTSPFWTGRPWGGRAALVLLLGLAACTPSRQATRPSPSARPPASAGADVRPTETFDPAAYPASIDTDAPAVPDVAHDVPADLMGNRTAPAPARPAPTPAPAPERPAAPREPVLRTLTGYRVQIFQSASKDEADRRVAEAIAWWRRSENASPEVYTLYRAPYYRVRVGNYATRAEADRAARRVGSSFPGAFVVQDRVTVRQ